MSRPPSPHEDAVVRRWLPRLRARARRVWFPHRIAMDERDIQQELAAVIVTACRRFPEYGGGDAEPTDAFVSAFVQKKLWNLCRKATNRKPTDSLTRDEDEGGGELALEDEMTPLPDAVATDRETQRVREGLVYALRRNLTPAAFAALHLRYLEDLSPVEIAALAGLREEGDDRRVTARIDSAKAVAAEFLRSLGVANRSQLDAVALEDFDAEELD